MQRDLDHVSEIQFNFVVSQRIEESVERFLQLGFEVSDNADDLVHGSLVQHTAGSVYEQTYVLVKLNVIRKLCFVHLTVSVTRPHCAVRLTGTTRRLV